MWTFSKKIFPGKYFLVGTTEEPYNEEYSVKALLQDDNSETSLEGQLPPYLPRAPASSNSCSRVLKALNVLLFITSLFLFATSGVHTGWPFDPLGNALIKKMSGPSPILDQIHIPIRPVMRNGSFVALDGHPSIWRQPPSEEVDAAWARLATLSPIPLSSDDVLRLGGDPKQTARFPEIFGLGDDAHVSRLDVFHLIHCLDAVRRDVYFDYYYSKKYPNGPDDAHYVHVTHCLSMLLQNLMCSAPLTPTLHYWSDTSQEPSPNFSDNHQCRDFDAILEWQEENSVELTYYRSIIQRPADVKPIIMPPEYKKLIGFVDPKER